MIYPRGMLVGKALLAVGILLAGIAGAIGASLRDDYLITKWETDNGLPENSATAMVQMPDGFLWFGTFNGLVRTDGEGFDVFRPFDTPELPGAKVVNLHLTGGTRLWVSTDRGLASLEQGVWRRHGEQTSWTNRFVRTFASGATGPLYLASFDGAVARVEGDELVEMPAPLPPGPQGAGFRLHVDETNGLWALRYDYFGRWNGQAWVAVAVPGVTNDFRSSFESSEGKLWVLTRDRLLCIAGEQVEKTVPLTKPVESVWSARQDADGNFWVASYQNGLYHVRPDGETTLHTMLDGLTYNALRFTLRDRAGTVWVGTSGGGLMRLRQRLFRTFGSEAALPVRAVKSVAEAAPGVVFLATYGSGLQRMDVTGPKAQFTTVGRGEGFAQCVLVDRSGRRWTGFYQTAASLTEGFTVRHLTRAEMGGASVTALFEDAAGRVWLGGSDRAMRFAGGQFEPMPEPAGLSAGAVRGFGQNPLDGSVWGATPHNLIQWSTNGVVAVAGPEGKAIANGNCLHFDADGTLWLGTEDTGLWCRREGKWTSVTTRHGLPANAIGAILTDAQGVFWIATKRGIVRATREALLAAAAGRVGTLSAHSFTLSDGLASAECPTGYQPTATRDSAGRLWFATLKGVALVNPADFAVERHAPHTRFTGVGFERSGTDREVPLPRRGEEIVLPPGSTHFGVRFAAPGAFDPARIRYHVEWLEDGTVVAEEESPRRFARATLLPPGNYRVRVTAINHHGVRSSVPAELGFVLQPHYWQTG